MIDEAESGETNLPEPKRIELLRQAQTKDPHNPSLYYQLGGRLEKNGRYDEAMQLYRAALSKGIESGRLHSRLADLLLRRGEKEPAIVEYEKAAQINPADLDSQNSQNNLATAYLEKGRLADAERAFKWILANGAGYAAAQNGMGLVSIQKQDHGSARTYFERAAQLDPELVEVHMNLGLLYEMSGERRPGACQLRDVFGESFPRSNTAASFPASGKRSLRQEERQEEHGLGLSQGGPPKLKPFSAIASVVRRWNGKLGPPCDPGPTM